MKPPRNQQKSVRFTEEGARRIDQERGQVDFAEYIRQAVAYAINHGFKVKESGL